MVADVCEHPDAERRAKRIAALPELLAACRAALANQEVLAPGIRNEAVTERLRAALEKAEGSDE
jgi:hypothetical protein